MWSWRDGSELGTSDINSLFFYFFGAHIKKLQICMNIIFLNLYFLTMKTISHLSNLDLMIQRRPIPVWTTLNNNSGLNNFHFYLTNAGRPIGSECDKISKFRHPFSRMCCISNFDIARAVFLLVSERFNFWNCGCRNFLSTSPQATSSKDFLQGVVLSFQQNVTSWTQPEELNKSPPPLPIRDELILLLVKYFPWLFKKCIPPTLLCICASSAKKMGEGDKTAEQE